MAYSADHLANQFLIAMPGMVDPNFSGSVIYLFEHTERGAMGLVINRPTELDMGALFEKIEVKLEAEPVSEQPVYFGGPVQIERGFVLHEATTEVAYSSSLAVPGGLTMTTSKDVLEAVAAGSGPSKFLMTLGYAGWSAGQLEEEITLNGWINVPLSQKQMVEIIFNTPSSQRYERTMGLLGFDPSHLSGEAGHA
ncbi:YqgE/AlgH family protein [Polynucleobacter sp. AP-Ainpum-60-G11]|uniref:YqgE/AlgH family protein n=1 Tax=Polynucleobacter sp. AP-Ainpum-60-G11 TaxID=2576926 RepID=UPI001BFDAC5D|nr:YqgE/AlgH family protein [Polynucleobacter sp. AP-Ainpum-60-G11]QWE27622.1 YqgE/AlgH family protein [Polynucleobacter sp. AP-Ainpum-60-G11]